MSKQTLGMAMIVQDEAVHLAVSISQFYHVVDELVVVDGGSVDSSVAWAEKMGAIVTHRPFDNDFAAQKNFAISQLSTDWVYLHDPDERLEPTLLEFLPQLIDPERQRLLMSSDVLPENTELFDCFGIARCNFIDGEQTDIYPDYQYRLFKNYCRFEGRVHEEIVGFKNRTEVDFKRNGESGRSRFNILHHKSVEKQSEQWALYAKIEEGLENEHA